MTKLIDITGKALSGEWGSDDETGDGIPVLRTTNFTNEGVVNYNDVVTRLITKKNIDEKYLRRGDIIIEKSGGSDKFPVGRVIYFDGDENTYLFNNFTGLLRVKNHEVWYPKYVFYSLFANYKRGGTRTFENKTTGLHNLKTDDFVSRYEVSEIGINEQISICNKLDKLFGIIKLREHELQILDDLIKARFVEMFGDSVTNPKGLPIVTLGELSELITKGASPSWQGFSYTDDSSQTIFVTSENVREGYIDLSFPKYIEDGFNEKQKKSVLHRGDFLINIVGASIGRAAQFNLDCKANMNQAAALVRVNDSRVRDKYLLTYLNSDRAQRMYDSMKSDTGRANLSLQDISDLLILLPNVEQQIEFEIFVNQVDKSKVAVQKALDETQMLFDSLMQEYFN